MWKRLLCLMLLLMLSMTTLTACETMGKWTGEGAGEVEEGADEFEEGYEEGKD
ncbi:MAG: hypothetical protein ACOCVU_01355 [Desulfohalobiaceae bacterium]